MHRHARCRLGHIALADARGNVFSIEKDAMAADGALKSDARILRHLHQRSFVVERSVPLDRLERQRSIHRPALQVHVAEFARQAGSDGALARSGWAVDGDDYFALGRIGHRGKSWECAILHGPCAENHGTVDRTVERWILIVWGRAPSPVQAEQSSARSLPT